MQTQKRLAAALMKVGENRVRLFAGAKEEVAMAITRADVRKLISKGYVFAVPVNSTSRGRIRKNKAQKKKGRQKGHGRRKGKKTARAPKKQQWMKKIRALRRALLKLRHSQEVSPSNYRKLYIRAKSGTVRDKAHLTQLIKKQKGE